MYACAIIFKQQTGYGYSILGGFIIGGTEKAK
jgi:hypothetical protein